MPRVHHGCVHPQWTVLQEEMLSLADSLLSFLNILFIHLAESVLSCGMWDLHYTLWNVLLWHMDSLVVVHRLWSYGAQA